MGSCTGESVCVWGGVGRDARQTAASSSHLSADSVPPPSPPLFFFFPPSLVADSRGGFCLPSLFEGFGLTVVEAASCGLPVFVSVHGGCREIIHDGVGGLHVDPNHPAAAADRIAAFFEAADDDGGATWAAASKAALARVAARYNWQTFARSLITMSRCVGGRLQWGERETKNRHSFSHPSPSFFFFSLFSRPFPSVYAFWSAATRLDQATAARRSYLQLIYQLILRPLMSRVPVPDEGGGGGGGGEGWAGAADGAACQGVCAVALGALADPGAVAPVAGGGAGGGSGGHGSASTSPRAGEDGK